MPDALRANLSQRASAQRHFGTCEFHLDTTPAIRQSTPVKGKKATAPSRLWPVTGIFMIAVGLPLSAYQQGSFFLFDLRGDAAASTGAAGRIALDPSIFKKAQKKTEGEIAKKREKSAFETEITDFKTRGKDSFTGSFEVLDENKEGSKTESAFDDSSSPSGGFFFTY